MTLDQLLNVSNYPEKWIIKEGKEVIFTGWAWELKDEMMKAKRSELYDCIKDREVEKFRFHLDIKHKQWKEKGLMSPLMPEELPQYEFSDLRTDMYYVAQLRKEQSDVKE